MKTISKTKEEFNQFYEEELKGEIEALEENRNNLKKRRNKQAKITVVAAVVPIVVGLIFSDYFIAFFIAALVVLIFGFSKLSKTYKAFEGVMKQRIVRKIVTFINPEFQYSPDKYISKEMFLDTKVFPKKPDKYLGDDLIWGSVYDQDLSETEKEHELSAQGSISEIVKDSLEQVHSSLDQNEADFRQEERPKTDIAFTEVTAIDAWTDSDGGSHESVIFQGLFFDVDFNKDFKGITVIAPRKDLFFDLKN